MADRIFHVRYADGTYGEAIAQDTFDAEDQLARRSVEMAHGAVPGFAPPGVEVSISTFGSERSPSESYPSGYDHLDPEHSAGSLVTPSSVAKGKKVDWKNLPPAEKADYLLAKTTIPDKSWTDEIRHKGESRSDFIKRVLAGNSTPAPDEASLVGYRRVFDGGCNFCREAAQFLYSKDDLLPIHENCNCGIAPVFSNEDHGLIPVPDGAVKKDDELGARLDQSAPAIGSSISDALHNVDVPQDIVDNALASINAVHSMPEDLPTVSLVRDTVSEYRESVTISKGDIAPTVVSIAQREGAGSDELVHEVGHFIEALSFLKPGYKKRILELAKQTPSFRDLRQGKYFRTPSEVWARAYEQWIATRSGNASMRSHQDGFGRYWNDDEFAPIAKAIDDEFAKVGLLK